MHFFLTLLLFFFALFSGKGHSQVTPAGSLQKRPDAVAGKLEVSRKAFWDSLPRPVGWVNDFEGLFTGVEEKKLYSLINDFKRNTSVEVAVVTVDATRASQENFDDLALRLHNAWGVGEKGKDKGILILISRSLRRIRISNGTGISKVLSDRQTKEIIDNSFLPYFKKGNFFTGTLTGLQALMKNF